MVPSSVEGGEGRDSQTLSQDILAAFRSNVRSILDDRRKRLHATQRLGSLTLPRSG